MVNKKSQLSKSLQLFNLEQIDRDIFSWTGKNVGYKRIFGGQVMAQTLIAAYNSSKAAVRHLSKSVALHCAKSTNLVRCNSIHPVFTRTAMVQSMIDSAPERDIENKLIQQIPIRKLAEPIDIANAAVFLASDESSFITGTELVVDGGLSAT